ncbi:coadhesin, partial [Exaiptasia diaphana]|uniref:Spondin-like TSP1 domain-containing protein n=1 Tax=Exaiptasia diaphana TaxID=2652724 RepID=A0A913Y3W5_EXADI
MRLLTLALIIVAFTLFVQNTEAWLGRRRRRRCSPGCVWSSWGGWGSCSVNCGGGRRWRSRYPRHGQGACGASCSGSSSSSSMCNSHCCRVDCSWSWSSWSPCRGCGISTQSRRVVIRRSPSCGGRACPSTVPQSRSCNTGVCCPVNCVVNSWGSWGACDASCEQSGKQTRTRSIRTRPSCKGTACPTLIDTKPCKGGCCRRDCLVSSWSAWSKCNAPSGKCGPNAGTRSRSRQITRQPSCGGKACPSLGESG